MGNNECIKCGVLCDLDICEDCLAIEQFEFYNNEADDPPDGWYDAWASYIDEDE